MDQERWITAQEWGDIIGNAPGVGHEPFPDVSIFKIPDFLKDTKREAYVPERILLGPYHHGNKKVRGVHHYKESAVREVIRSNAHFANTAINAIMAKEVEIRDSYEESIDCDRETLARMLCLDGCFILQTLKDVGGSSYFACNALKEILMLENQIPWIVLLELVRSQHGGAEAAKTLLNVMLTGTRGLFGSSIQDNILVDWLQSREIEVHHLLGFVHKVIVDRPPGQDNPGNQGEHRISIGRCIGRCLQMLQDKNKALNHDFESIPPAIELKNAGIKFRPCDGGICHIKFDRDSSTIYLPLLAITYDTEVLFRNLIAFEMCKSSQVNYFTSYVNLRDDLIDSQNDVAFLRSMGILKNLIGSDQEVADLFNGLFKGVSVRIPSLFDEVRKVVNANYKNRIRVQLAEVWRDHFSSPSKTIALAVGFAILCLTLIQTIYTVM